MHCLSQEIIDIRELSVKGVHHCPISQGLDQLLPLFQSTMIWNYDRAASAALWDEHVATKVFRVVSSDRQLDSTVVEAVHGDVNCAAAEVSAIRSMTGLRFSPKTSEQSSFVNTTISFATTLTPRRGKEQTLIR